MTIRNFINRVQVESEQMRRAVIIELFSSVITDTPVDKGLTRGNWQTNISAPITTETARHDKTAQAAINDVRTKAQASHWGQDMYLTNNKPHIFKLEYGGYPNPPRTLSGKTINGFSRQAPQGMLRRNIIRIESIIRLRARGVR